MMKIRIAHVLHSFGIGGLEAHVVKRYFRYDLTAIFRLAHALKQSRPDIVRTYNWPGIEGVIAAALCGIKNIIHISLIILISQRKEEVLRGKGLRICLISQKQ